jgi:predicted transcriptional regulator
MTDQTTVRLSVATRDEVNRLADERGVTADRAIADAIKAVRDEEWRRQAERELLEAHRDPAYRAELAAAVRDLRGEDE